MREVRGEVNRARRRLRRAYFEQMVSEAEGDARASWEVLREVIGLPSKMLFPPIYTSTST